MKARSTLTILKPLIQDTIRQAWASGICWMMLGVTALCVVLCLSVSVSGDVSLQPGDEPVLFLPPPSPGGPPPAAAAPTAADPNSPIKLETNREFARREGIETLDGRMSLAFGALSFPVSRERADAVRFLELLMAGGLAGTVGLLLTLVWTAGFVPSFLDRSAASVLLAKPVARWQLLLGKYVGVLTFVGLQVALFVATTWLALGVRTRVWDATYLWCAPLLLVQFAIFYSFSILLAVVTRSTVACVFGCVLFWLLAWATNYGSIMVRELSETRQVPPSTRAMAEVAYWISPKPIDAGAILFDALDARHHFEKPRIFARLESWPAYSPRRSILSSLLLMAVLLGLSAYELESKDY